MKPHTTNIPILQRYQHGIYTEQPEGDDKSTWLNILALAVIALCAGLFCSFALLEWWR